MKTERTQADNKGDQYSQDSALDCSREPSVTRQEFKDEADINNLLRRFGIGAVQRPITWGERDFDQTLTDGMLAMDVAKDAFNRLPADIAKQYGTWEGLLRAIEAGTVKQDFLNAQAKETPTDATVVQPAPVTTPTGSA